MLDVVCIGLHLHPRTVVWPGSALCVCVGRGNCCWIDALIMVKVCWDLNLTLGRGFARSSREKEVIVALFNAVL